MPSVCKSEFKRAVPIRSRNAAPSPPPTTDVVCTLDKVDSLTKGLRVILNYALDQRQKQ